jgi:hypothetical protein
MGWNGIGDAVLYGVLDISVLNCTRGVAESGRKWKKSKAGRLSCQAAGRVRGSDVYGLMQGEGVSKRDKKKREDCALTLEFQLDYGVLYVCITGGDAST